MEKRYKGQVSIELAVIIGFVLILIIPSILYVFNFLGNESHEDLVISQTDFLGSRLKHSINMIGSTGTGSALKTQIRIPDNFESLEMQSDEIIIKVFIAPGKLDLVKVVNYKIESEGLERISAPGTYNLEIEALNETHVKVSLI